MFFQVVAVKDLAVNSFTTPVVVNHVGSAIREFTSAASNPKSEFYIHAADFELFHLGEFDSDTGEVVCFPEGPRRLIRALDVKAGIDINNSLPLSSFPLNSSSVV